MSQSGLYSPYSLVLKLCVGTHHLEAPLPVVHRDVPPREAQSLRAGMCSQGDLGNKAKEE